MSEPAMIDFTKFIPRAAMSEAQAKAAASPPETRAEAIARRRTTLTELALPIPDEDVERVVTRVGLVSTGALNAVRTWHQALARRAAEEAAAYAAGDKPASTPPRRVLALLGDVGTGKTVAAAHLLAERPGAYIKLDAAGVLRAQRAAEDRKAWKRIKGSPLLVLDEIGHEVDLVLGKAALHELLDERQGGGKLTLLIGNLSEAQLRSRYDKRTIDRLGRMWRVQRCAGESMRAV